jgi:hypothetical protein
MQPSLHNTYDGTVQRAMYGGRATIVTERCESGQSAYEARLSNAVFAHLVIRHSENPSARTYRRDAKNSCSNATDSVARIPGVNGIW